MGFGGNKTWRQDIIDSFDPRILGRAATKGTLFRYIPTVGLPVLLIKVDEGFSTNWIDASGGGGGGGNDWHLTGNTLTGGSPSTPNEFMGSTNNFDVKFERNNLEKIRLNNDGLLVGLDFTSGEPAAIQVLAVPDQGIIKKILNPGTATRVVNIDRMNRVTTVGASTAINNQPVPTDFVGQMEYKISVKQTSGGIGAIGDGASFVRTLHVRNIGGVATILFEQTDLTYKIDTALDVQFTAVGMNIQTAYTGVLGRNLSWGTIVNLHLIEG